MKEKTNIHPIVDRTYENLDEPIIFVTLENGWQERFWLTGLTDDEYIKRTRLIRDHER